MNFDYVIVGGGSAGAVLARRLADDPSISVCLIEAGPDYENDPKVRYLSEGLALVGNDKYDYDYPVAPQPRGNSLLRMSRARMLGGCSAHNDMWALRAPAEDMDRWQDLGAQGWNAASTDAHFDKIFREMRVHPVTKNAELGNAWLRAAAELGVPVVDNTSGANYQEGISWVSLNEDGGMRVSTAVAYLFPLSELPDNLTVMCDTKALKVVIDNGEAVGVATEKGVVRAEREIVVSAGAVDTPKLLMLSGIGPADHLRSHDIQVIADLPGVGSNLQDHIEAPVTWESNRAAGESINGFDLCVYSAVNGASSFNLQTTIGYVSYWLWAAPFDELPRPDIAFSFVPNVARPRSHGTVRLASADHTDKPIFDPAYFTDPDNEDERLLVEGVRLARRFAETRELKDWIVREVTPGPELQSDDELGQFVRKYSNTVYHPCCTAKIGADDDAMAVLDSHLRVRGVDRLRVADASVFPEIPRVNINMTTIMVGSKAAELITGR
jgi:choline oxidase